MSHQLILRGKTIGIIGAGNMGQALVNGLLAAGLSPRRMLVVEANPIARRAVVNHYRVRLAPLERLVPQCHVVIIAVKPQDIRPVLERLRRRGGRPLIISIAAGVTLAALERLLGRRAVVRVMPNLPAKVGCAMSAVAAGRFATASHRAIAKAIFSCVGEVAELPERFFDVVTAVSGSGPAYFFAIFEAMRDAAVRAGVPKAIAERLTIHTALGSAKLAEASPDGLDALIKQVASKGGTTEAALRVLAKRRVLSHVGEALRAAARRSRELSSRVLNNPR